MFALKDSDHSSFKKNGYLVRKKVVPISYIEEVILTFIAFCKKLGGKDFNSFDVADFFNSENLSKKLIELRENKPSIYGAIYDTMQTTVSMQKMALSELILNDISKLLNCPTTNLMCFNYLFRMDPPFCNRNKLDWHQDFIDYDQLDMADGITAWIPLINIDKELGPLKLLQKSHLDGKVRNYKILETNGNQLSSHKHTIEKDIIKKYKNFSLPVNVGDIIYLSMNLIHASGENTSNKIRFSGQGRFYNILSKSFPPGKTLFIKSKI